MIDLILLLALAALNPIDFGAKGDCVTNDYPAFARMLAKTETSTESYVHIPSPKGACYKLNSTLVISKHVRMEGDSGAGWGAKTVLQFPRCVSGILIKRPAGFSTLENFAVRGTMGGDCYATGIKIEGPEVKLSNMRVYDFSGNAIVMDCDVTPPRSSDCSLARIENLRVETCGGWGLYTNGGDSNALLALGLDISDMGMGCMKLDDFLGGTHIAGHCNVAEIPGAKAIIVGDPSSRQTFVGQYVEGPREVKLTSNNIWIGGLGGTMTGYGGVVRDGKIDGLGFAVIRARAKNVGDMLMELDGPTFPGTWMLQMFYGLTEQRYYQQIWARQSVPYQIADYGADTPAGSMVMPEGAYLGQKNTRNKITFNLGIPTRGQWRKGDLSFNSGDGCAFYKCLAPGKSDDVDVSKRPRWMCANVVFSE